MVVFNVKQVTLLCASVVKECFSLMGKIPVLSDVLNVIVNAGKISYEEISSSLTANVINSSTFNRSLGAAGSPLS